MYLVEEIKDGFIKDIMSSIGYGVFALVFAIPLTFVGFALKNDENSLLAGVIFVFVAAGVMYLLFIGMAISIIKSVVNMIKFFRDNKIEFYDADLIESKDKSIKFILEQLKDKHINFRGKRFIFIEDYLILLKDNPAICNLNCIYAAYRDIMDKNILIRDRLFSKATVVFVIKDGQKYKHKSIQCKTISEATQLLNYLENIHIDVYEGYDSFKEYSALD